MTFAVILHWIKVKYSRRLFAASDVQLFSSTGYMVERLDISSDFYV